MRVEYKRPRRINRVSITLTILLGIAAYVVYSIYPVYLLRSTVKGELEGILPQLYRANLRPPPLDKQEHRRLYLLTLETLRRVGVKDKKLELLFNRDKKRVSIEARFKTEALFDGLNKRVEFAMAPKVETDAGRVEW